MIGQNPRLHVRETGTRLLDCGTAPRAVERDKP